MSRAAGTGAKWPLLAESRCWKRDMAACACGPKVLASSADNHCDRICSAVLAGERYVYRADLIRRPRSGLPAPAARAIGGDSSTTASGQPSGRWRGQRRRQRRQQRNPHRRNRLTLRRAGDSAQSVYNDLATNDLPEIPLLTFFSMAANRRLRF